MWVICCTIQIVLRFYDHFRLWGEAFRRATKWVQILIFILVVHRCVQTTGKREIVAIRHWFLKWESQCGHRQLLPLLFQIIQNHFLHLLILHNVLVHFFENVLIHNIIVFCYICLTLVFNHHFLHTNRNRLQLTTLHRQSRRQISSRLPITKKIIIITRQIIIVEWFIQIRCDLLHHRMLIITATCWLNHIRQTRLPELAWLTAWFQRGGHGCFIFYMGSFVFQDQPLA